MFDTMTQEQQMVQETLTALLADAGLGDDGAVPFALWSELANAGLLSLGVPEAHGGLGGTPADLALIMRRLGAIPGETPYLASAILGTALLTSLASDTQWQALAPGLLDGSVILAPAISEAHARYDWLHTRTSAARVTNGLVVSGEKTLVPSGAYATHFVVSARTSGTVADSDGIVLLVVPASADGVQVRPYISHDGSHDADVCLTNVRIEPEWELAGGHRGTSEAIAASTDLAIALASSEAVGAMEELLSLTIDYLKLRKQFGVPIGSFQSLQHAAVDMFVEVEQAKSMAGYAVGMLEAAPETRSAALLGSKSHLNVAARFVGETAVQLHGAIGMTMESKAGRLFQRLTRFQLRYGDRNHCLATLATTGLSLLEN